MTISLVESRFCSLSGGSGHRMKQNIEQDGGQFGTPSFYFAFRSSARAGSCFAYRPTIKGQHTTRTGLGT